MKGDSGRVLALEKVLLQLADQIMAHRLPILKQREQLELDQIRHQDSIPQLLSAEYLPDALIQTVLIGCQLRAAFAEVRHGQAQEAQERQELVYGRDEQRPERRPLPQAQRLDGLFHVA